MLILQDFGPKFYNLQVNFNIYDLFVTIAEQSKSLIQFLKEKGGLLYPENRNQRSRKENKLLSYLRKRKVIKVKSCLMEMKGKCQIIRNNWKIILQKIKRRKTNQTQVPPQSLERVWFLLKIYLLGRIKMIKSTNSLVCCVCQTLYDNILSMYLFFCLTSAKSNY